MNQPPLNPDAIERTVAEVYGDGPRMDWPSDITGFQTHRDYARTIVEQIVSAYLAAALPETRCVERHSPDLVCDGCEPPTPALPEVTSVEELEALPAKTVILDSHGDVSVITETGLFMCDDGDCYELDEVADDLPARVLYRPEVNDA